MRTSEELKQLIEEEAEQAERTRDEPMVGGVRRGRTRSEVYSIRLTPEEVAEIQRIADEASMPASGLVRDWVRQGLDAERGDSVEQTVESLSRDVDRLKRQLASAEHRRRSRKRKKVDA